MTKTYQLSHKGYFGISLKIVPVTTKTQTNTIQCYGLKGTNESRIFPQSFLPDIRNFKVICL